MSASTLVLVIVKLVVVVAYVCYLESILPWAVPSVHVLSIDEVDSNRLQVCLGQGLYYGLWWKCIRQHGSQPQIHHMKHAWGNNNRTILPWPLVIRDLLGRDVHAPADTYHCNPPTPRGVGSGLCPEVCWLKIDVDCCLIFEDTPGGAKQYVAWHAVTLSSPGSK